MHQSACERTEQSEHEEHPSGANRSCWCVWLEWISCGMNCINLLSVSSRRRWRSEGFLVNVEVEHFGARWRLGRIGFYCCQNQYASASLPLCTFRTYEEWKQRRQLLDCAHVLLSAFVDNRSERNKQGDERPDRRAEAHANGAAAEKNGLGERWKGNCVRFHDYRFCGRLLRCDFQFTWNTGSSVIEIMHDEAFYLIRDENVDEKWQCIARLWA